MKRQVSLLHTTRARWIVQLPVFQKIQGSPKLKEGNGHIICTYPLQSCLTWTKSIRLWERLTIEDVRMKWRTSTWTRLFWTMCINTTLQAAVHLGQDNDQNLQLSRIISGVLWRSYSKKLKIDQEPERDSWCINDWLRRAHIERDKLGVWQNQSDHECQNLRLRRLGALSGRYEREPERSLEGEKEVVFRE